jgi:hypothetical protein
MMLVLPMATSLRDLLPTFTLDQLDEIAYFHYAIGKYCRPTLQDCTLPPLTPNHYPLPFLCRALLLLHRDLLRLQVR